MTLNELLNESTPADAIKNAIDALVAKISKISAIGPFLVKAKKQQTEINAMLKTAKSGADLQTKLKALAQEMMAGTPAPVTEGVFNSPAILGVLASMAALITPLMAKAIGIYQKMGQPDIIDGSHLNMVGGLMFGVLPSLAAAALAIFCFMEVYENAKRKAA